MRVLAGSSRGTLGNAAAVFVVGGCQYETPGTKMQPLEILRLLAAALTIAGAVLVAVNWSPRTTVIGFAVFIAASVAWMVDGWLEEKNSILVQNAVLLLVNIAGVYRWLPKVEQTTQTDSV